MWKFNKKITAILGTATLAIGLVALPAIAGTTEQPGNGWVGQMQGFMMQTLSQEQHQELMNSKDMQNLHNSQGMQDAMQTGDVKAMQEFMNSDPNVKALMGQDNLDKMNEFMSQSGGNMMTNGSDVTSSESTMMNGSGTLKAGSNMMDF
ncbi:hypothetical protein [Desulfosporosinus fructosivorans]